MNLLKTPKGQASRAAMCALRGFLVPPLIVIAVLMAGCESGGPGTATVGPSPTPEATATVEPTPSPAPAVLDPVPTVTLGDIVTFHGGEAGDGAMAVTAGDFNGDGIRDVVLSASEADGPDNGRPEAGEVHIFYGPFEAGEVYDVALGQQDVTIFGATAGDRTGLGLTTGDVNGDGIDDLAIGAPFASPQGGLEEAGLIYIVFGGFSLPETIDLATDEPDVLIRGAGQRDLTGFSLAAGDVRGDGVEDLIVGAIWVDGPDGLRTAAGAVYVVFGSSSPAAVIDVGQGEQDVAVYGAGNGDRLGTMVAQGDVNGDGVTDLVLGAPMARPAEGRKGAGEIYVIWGGGTLAARYDAARRDQDLTIAGPNNGDQLGHSLAVGDVNGDGFADIFAGALSADGPDGQRRLAGAAYLILGDPGLASPDTSAGEYALLIHGGSDEDRLGRSVAMGDVNGDGRMDVSVAAPGVDVDAKGSDAGRVYLVFGRETLSGALDLAARDAEVVVDGRRADDLLGHDGYGKPSHLAIDMDGDGLDDLLITARGDGPEGDRLDAGEAYLILVRR